MTRTYVLQLKCMGMHCSCVLCIRVKILLFSVVFSLIRTVRKLALRLLETEHLTNGDQLKVM